MRQFIYKDPHRVAVWGPRYAGIEEDISKYSLLEICALQWRCCVQKATTDLVQFSSERVFTLQYEDFVSSPQTYLGQIAEWCGYDTTPYQKLNLETISNSNIGKGITALDDAQIGKVTQIISKVSIDTNIVPNSSYGG